MDGEKLKEEVVTVDKNYKEKLEREEHVPLPKGVCITREILECRKTMEAELVERPAKRTRSTTLDGENQQNTQGETAGQADEGMPAQGSGGSTTSSGAVGASRPEDLRRRDVCGRNGVRSNKSIFIFGIFFSQVCDDGGIGAFCQDMLPIVGR